MLCCWNNLKLEPWSSPFIARLQGSRLRSAHPPCCLIYCQEVKTAELPEVAEAQADAPADSSVPVTVTNEQGEEIYLGFEKGDFQPREGRKGRTIVDDAERYPSRSEMSGGWAGGEVGLQQFVEVGACLPCIMSMHNPVRPSSGMMLSCAYLRIPERASSPCRCKLWHASVPSTGACMHEHVMRGAEGRGCGDGARQGRSGAGEPRGRQGGQQIPGGAGRPRQVPQQGLHRPLLCVSTAAAACLDIS